MSISAALHLPSSADQATLGSCARRRSLAGAKGGQSKLTARETACADFIVKVYVTQSPLARFLAWISARSGLMSRVGQGSALRLF